MGRRAENWSSSIIATLLRPVASLARESKVLRMANFKMQEAGSLLAVDTGVGTFVVSSADSAIGFSTFINRMPFEADKFRLVCDLLGEPRDLLLDVGANIGTVGLTALGLENVREVWAFEPDPLNFALLSANVSINQLHQRVRLFNAAVGDGVSKFLDLELAVDNLGDHRVRFSSVGGDFDEEGREVIQVPSVAIDQVVSGVSLGRAILWMDVQGAEGTVLAGATRLLAEKVPVVTEFWPYGLDRSGGYDSFVSSLTGYRYNDVIDLSEPDRLYPCVPASFSTLWERYSGVGNGQTDLLII